MKERFDVVTTSNLFFMYLPCIYVVLTLSFLCILSPPQAPRHRDSAGAGNAGGATNAMNNGVGEEKRVCLGEIFMAIQWQPRSADPNWTILNNVEIVSNKISVFSRVSFEILFLFASPVFCFHVRYQLIVFLVPCFSDGTAVHFVLCLTIKCAIRKTSQKIRVLRILCECFLALLCATRIYNYMVFLGIFLCAHGKGCYSCEPDFHCMAFCEV